MVLSFRGAGVVREPGIHEHRPLRSLKVLVFVDSGLRPADGPGMTEGFSHFKLRHYPAVNAPRFLIRRRVRVSAIGRDGAPTSKETPNNGGISVGLATTA